MASPGALVAASDRVAATRCRREKIALLAAALEDLAPDEIALERSEPG